MIRLAFILFTVATMTMLSPLNNVHSLLDATASLVRNESHDGFAHEALTAAVSSATQEVLASGATAAQGVWKLEPTRVALLRPTLDPPLAPRRPTDLR